MKAPPGEFARAVGKKARRLRRSRTVRRSFWQGLIHVGALGWMFVIPVVIGAFVGHWLRRFTSSRSLSVAPLLLGVAIGVYVVARELWGSLADDDDDDKEGSA